MKVIQIKTRRFHFIPTRIAITNMDGHKQTESLVLLVEILAVPSLTDHTSFYRTQ